MAEVPRAFYAVVKMVLVRQVDFYAPPDATDEQLEELALEKARREYGSADEVEIKEMDYR